MAAHALYKGTIAACIGRSIGGEMRKECTRLYGMQPGSNVRTHAQSSVLQMSAKGVMMHLSNWCLQAPRLQVLYCERVLYILKYLFLAHPFWKRTTLKGAGICHSGLRI